MPKISDVKIPNSFKLKFKIPNSFLQNLEDADRDADSKIPVQGPKEGINACNTSSEG
jgi:hypothetical protein